MLFVLAVLLADPQIMTLDQAISLARQYQPKLTQAEAETEAAQARSNQARAALLPQLVGTFSYQRNTANQVYRPSYSPNDVILPAPRFKTDDFFNTGVTLNQLIFDFWQTPGKWQAAKAATKAQQHNEKAAWQQTVYNVRAAYFAARASKALVNVATEALTNQEKHFKQIETFVTVGTRPEIDLAQAKVDLANIHVQLVNAQNGYATSKAQLNQAIGREDATDFDIGDDSFSALEEENQTSEALIDAALSGRGDFITLFEQLRAQEITANALLGGFAPTLAFFSSFTDAGTAMNNLRWNWAAGVNLSWSLFQGGFTVAQVEETRAKAKVLRAQMHTLRLQALFELEQARLAVSAAKASLDYSNDAVRNSRERLRLAEGRYETGVGNVIELGDAQLAFTNASAQEVQAEYNLASARAQLMKALGRDT
jgi:outer membrane protein